MSAMSQKTISASALTNGVLSHREGILAGSRDEQALGRYWGVGALEYGRGVAFFLIFSSQIVFLCLILLSSKAY
jgi:hypothetical protein